MTAPRLVASLAVALAAPACLPDRDNPNDTANRPVATLELSNGAFSGVCEAPDSIDRAFSRGRCLTLSGGSSTDPQGADDIEGWTFEIQTSEGTVLIVDSPRGGPLDVRNDDPELPSLLVSASDGAAVRVLPTFLRRLPVGEDLQVTMRVRDGAGESEPAIGEFELVNTRPVTGRPGTRYVPRFGSLWKRLPNGAVGGSLEVRLDAGEPLDAEDDPLSYCWRERDEDLPPWSEQLPCDAETLASACDHVQPYVEDLVSSDGDQAGMAVLYELRVCDGTLWSRPEFASIVRGLTPGWVVEDDFGRAAITDPDVRTETIPYRIVGVPGLTFPGTSVRAFFGYDDPATFVQDRNLVRTQLVTSSGMAPVGVATLDADAVVKKVLPAQLDPPLAWVIAAVGSSGVGVYAISGTSGTLQVSGPWFPDPAIPAGYETFTAVNGETGTLWLSASFQQTVWGLEVDGSSNIQEVERIDLDREVGGLGARMVTGVALRPPAGAQPGGARPLVIAHSAHVLVPDGSDEPTGALFRSDDGTVDDVTFFLPDDTPLPDGALLLYGHGPHFIGHGTFYLSFFGEGVGAYALEPNQPVAVLLSFSPSPLVGFDAAVHPNSQHLVLIADGQQTLLRTGPDGASTEILTTEKITQIYTDGSNQRLWTLIAGGDGTYPRLLGGQGTGVETVMQRFAIPPGFDRSRPSIDYASGDLWVPSVIPFGISRFFADGRLADLLHSVEIAPGDTLGLGAAVHVASDPADGTVWIVTVQGTSGNANIVWRVDPVAERPAPGVGVAAGVAALPLGADEDVMEVFAEPVVESTAGALVMLVRREVSSGMADYTLQRLESTGDWVPASPEPLLTAELSPQPVFAARDLVIPSLCVAAKSPSSNQILVRRYSRDLSAKQEVAFPVPGAPRVYGVAAFDGDCWVAFRGGASLGLARVPFSTPAAVSVTGLPSEPSGLVPMIAPDTIRPETSHRVWVSFPNEDVLRRYALQQSGGTLTIVEDETVRTDGDVLLLTP